MSSIYLKPSGRFYYIAFFVAFAVLSLILYTISSFIQLQFNIWQAIFMLLLMYFVALGGAFLYFQQSYIHVEDDIMTVREGILFSKVMVIPFSKIKEIKTQYTFIDRLLGVGTVAIDIAETPGMEIVFSHVPKESINSFLSMFRQHKENGKNQAADKR